MKNWEITENYQEKNEMASMIPQPFSLATYIQSPFSHKEIDIDIKISV